MLAQGYGGYDMGYQQKPMDYQGGGYQVSQAGYYAPAPYDGGYRSQQASVQQPYGSSLQYHQGAQLGAYQP